MGVVNIYRLRGHTRIVWACTTVIGTEKVMEGVHNGFAWRMELTESGLEFYTHAALCIESSKNHYSYTSDL
jgi:hypothetical protein